MKMEVGKFFVAKTTDELLRKRREFESQFLDYDVYTCRSTYDAENKLWIDYVTYRVRKWAEEQ